MRFIKACLSSNCLGFLQTSLGAEHLTPEYRQDKAPAMSHRKKKKRLPGLFSPDFLD